MSSIKECTLAFFKGLAFGKGLIIGRELAENKDMAEDRWITIHPWGMSQGEADTGEGKGYYRRIFIDDETGEIEKGLGAGTNIKDLSKTLKAKKNGEEAENTSKKDDTNLSDLAKKIKALTDGKEYTEEVANQVGDVMRQELEKNQKFADLVRRLDLSKKFSEESNSTFMSVGENEKYKKAKSALSDYRTELLKKWERGEYEGFISDDPEYKRLRTVVHEAMDEAIAEKKNAILKKLNVSEKDRDFVSKGYTPGDRKISEEVANIFREQFKDIIDFNDGNNLKSSKAQKSNITNGLAMYSKEFVEALNKNVPKVETLRKGSRSYYAPMLGSVHITLDDTYGTIAHEFAHAVESSIPDIKKIEKDFYYRRTKGEQSQYLRTLTGNRSYGYDEVAKPDKFLNPYMGKDYSGHGDNHNYELLSMGMSYLYDKPEELVKDKDYMNFVLGCLAYKG